MVKGGHQDSGTLGLRHKHGHVAVGNELAQELPTHTARGREGLLLERNHCHGRKRLSPLANRFHRSRSLGTDRGAKGAILNIAARVNDFSSVAAQGSTDWEVAVRHVGVLPGFPGRLDQFLVRSRCKSHTRF